MDSAILVVDDDPRLRQVITEVLSDEGYLVYEAADGQRALEQVDAIAPDLVLSDIRMPRLTGVELARRLRHRRNPAPVVLMSASSNAPPEDGFTFLAKPFAINDLVALVSDLLARNAARANRNDGWR